MDRERGLYLCYWGVSRAPVICIAQKGCVVTVVNRIPKAIGMTKAPRAILIDKCWTVILSLVFMINHLEFVDYVGVCPYIYSHLVVEPDIFYN